MKNVVLFEEKSILLLPECLESSGVGKFGKIRPINRPLIGGHRYRHDDLVARVRARGVGRRLVRALRGRCAMAGPTETRTYRRDCHTRGSASDLCQRTPG